MHAQNNQGSQLTACCVLLGLETAPAQLQVDSLLHLRRLERMDH